MDDDIIVIDDTPQKIPNRDIKNCLPSLARSSCIRSGINDSTCIKLSITQLSSIIRDTLLKIKTNTISQATGVQLLYNISEKSVVLLNNQTSHSLVIDILGTALHLVQFHDHNITIEQVLASQFLQQATQLVVAGVKEDTKCSYEFSVLLWQLYFPSYRDTLLEVLKVGVSMGVANVKSLSKIREACTRFTHFKLYTIDFFKHAIENSTKNNTLIIEQLYAKIINPTEL